MNAGVTAVMFIDCIAAMPWGAGRRRSPCITNDENANRAPALSPQPSAVTTVNATRRSSIVSGPLEETADAFQTPLVAVACGGSPDREPTLVGRPRLEPLHDPAAGLAGAAQDQRRLVVRICVIARHCVTPLSR
jgi:hypothetical protein